jgi:ribosomal protein S18 acetylase RimI-like enzyme
MVIRPTRLEDLSRLVQTHMAAFAGSLGVELGEKYVTEFVKWFVTDSEAINLVCEKDRRIAGYVFGAPTGYNTRMNRALIGTIAWATITHPHVVMRSGFLRQLPARVRAMLGKATRVPESTTQETPERSFRLTGIGVSPEFRRQGIAQALIRGYEEQVWERGYEVIYLSVYATNDQARALYESCGWRAVNDGEVVTYKRERR